MIENETEYGMMYPSFLWRIVGKTDMSDWHKDYGFCKLKQIPLLYSPHHFVISDMKSMLKWPFIKLLVIPKTKTVCNFCQLRDRRIIIKAGRRPECKIGLTIWEEPQSDNFWSDQNSENASLWP